MNADMFKQVQKHYTTPMLSHSNILYVFSCYRSYLLRVTRLHGIHLRQYSDRMFPISLPELLEHTRTLKTVQKLCFSDTRYPT